MKHPVFRLPLSVAVLFLLAHVATPANAQTLVKDRITGPIRADQVTVVPGGLHPLTTIAKDEGALPGDFAIHGMELVFDRSTEQQADLQKLLAQQQARGNAMYHKWLTPSQFAARYGVSQSDLNAVAAWLQSQGFTVNQVPPSADRIVFSGTAAQVESVFHTEMHRYNLHGTEYWANSTELSFPQAIAGMVLGVRHLNTFRPLPTHYRKQMLRAVRVPGSTADHPKYTVQNNQGQYFSFLAPADVQTIYDISPMYQSGITGSGQFIGIMGQSNITTYMSDITNFRALSGLNTNNLPQQVLVPNSGSAVSVAPGQNGGDLNESDLDVEWSGAVAPDASIAYVTVGNNTNYSVMDSLTYAVQTPLLNYANNQTQLSTNGGGNAVIPVLSISYGACEQDWQQSDMMAVVQLGQQANAQGQTILASGGDDGSADCDGTVTVNGNQVAESAATMGLAVDFPGSSPYTTSAGGTSFVGDRNNLAQYWSESGMYTTAAGTTNGTALSYIPEGAWNDSPNATLEQQNGGLGAGGGGVSEVFNASPNYSLSSMKAPALPSSMSYLAGKPSWQAANGVPSDGARDVPDVSLAADPDWDGYVVCTEETDSNNNLTGTSSCLSPSAASSAGLPDYTDSNSNISSFGGTSVSSPQLAAMITLWDQAQGYVISMANGALLAGGVGNANYLFYPLYKTSPSAFHDVVSNNIYPEANSNAVVCQQGTPSCIPDPTTSGNYVMSGYSVEPGYDLATGLGSVDVSAMATVWGSASVPYDATTSSGAPAADFQIVANPSQATVSPGSSTTVAINVTALAGFTGTVSLSCSLPSTASAGITCGLSPTSVTLGASGTTTLTINASSSASLRPLRLPVAPASNGPWQGLAGGGISLAALFLLGLPAQRRRFARMGKRTQWTALAMLLLVVSVAAAVGCNSSMVTPPTGGGGGSGSGSGSGGTVNPPALGQSPNINNVVIVTATSGSGTSAISHAIAVPYTVQ